MPSRNSGTVADCILTGRFSRARRLLRAHPALPDHAALVHLATEDTPLPVPLCGCADHPDRSTAPPPSAWLKTFFTEGDSLYDADNMLCLSCHTAWQHTEEQMTPAASGWYRRPLSRYQDRQGWQLGMDDASPGDDILAEPAALIRWIRRLEASVASYGML